MRTRLQWKSDRLIATVTAQQQIRVIGIGDVVHVTQRYVGFTQAIVNGMKRQLPGRKRNGPLGMLDMRETLFLGGRDHDAVANQASGRVMVGSVDSKRVHARWLPWKLLQGV